MRIQHNITAMNAYRNYNTNTNALGKNLEKLSSGYKINRAGDDAAGLAISEKMRAQITGLDVAQKNAQDGISLVQTAEGALTEVHDMLNRMVELADQSANGTYDVKDREQLQKEVEELKNEINRIADSSNFNGINLLDGSLSGESTPAGGVLGGMIASADGVTASAAVTAVYTLDVTLTGNNTLNDGSIFKDLTSAANLTSVGDCVLTLADGTTAKVSDYFTVTGDTTNGFTLTAKGAGAVTDKIDDALTASSNVEVATAGVNAGEGAPSSKAKYEFTFDFDTIMKYSGGSFELGGKTFKIYNGGAPTTPGANEVIIDLGKYNMSTVGDGNTVGVWGAQKEIYDAINNAFKDNFDIKGEPTAAPATTTTDLKITITAKEAGSAANLGEFRAVDGSGAAANIGVTVNATEGTDAGKGTEGSCASVTYKLDLSRFQEGDTLTIGGQTITVVKDEEADPMNGKVTLSDLKDGDRLSQIFEAMGNQYGMIKFDTSNKTVTITGTTEGQKVADAAITISAVCADDTATVGNDGLTLQIGDTSDTFNQLNVKIKDCHVTSMDIDDIDISTQAGAKSAIDLVKSAIDYVSDVRGTLGATQNRLEHTINNLSVMEENIQNAESAIRDTDVAEEMMSYTKNNILIQSAQAMLAQANQVPQGVLQLLQ